MGKKGRMEFRTIKTTDYALAEHFSSIEEIMNMPSLTINAEDIDRIDVRISVKLETHHHDLIGFIIVLKKDTESIPHKNGIEIHTIASLGGLFLDADYMLLFAVVRNVLQKQYGEYDYIWFKTSNSNYVEFFKRAYNVKQSQKDKNVYYINSSDLYY